MRQQETRPGRPSIVGIGKGIGPLEARVLRVMSDLTPPVTVRGVCDAWGREGYFVYQGVLNTMNRLVKKGILARSKDKDGNAFMYRPLVDPEELTAEVVMNVLGHMGGKLDRVICRVLKIDPDVGADQFAELRKRLQSMSRGRKR